MTATQTLDPATARRVVDNLAQALTLLAQAGADMPQIAQHTLAAHDTVDNALMIATNEMKLAQREASTTAA